MSLKFFKRGYEISREEKVGIIEALHRIAETFADLAFGMHPIQQLSDNPAAIWEAIVAEAQDLPIPEEVERLMSERFKKQPT